MTNNNDSYTMIDRANNRHQESWFRNVDPDLYEKFDGDMQAPEGWFGLLVVDEDFWMAKEVLGGHDDTDFLLIPTGTYLVRIDNNGVVWAYQAETDEADTRIEYQKIVARHAEWSAQEEEG